MTNFREEFPDFPPETMPAIPADWVDVSWRNDLSPCFEAIPVDGPRSPLLAWIGYADRRGHELEDAPRFMLQWQESRVVVAESEDWNDILAAVAELRTLDIPATLIERGFELIETGGGGKAYRLIVGADQPLQPGPVHSRPEIVVTDGSGMYEPITGDWLIGFYPDETWQPEPAGIWPMIGQAMRFQDALDEALSEAGLIALRFAESLFAELGAGTFQAIRRENVNAAPGTCAAHDYCDANMNMAAAFEAVTGREPDCGSDDDAALWSRAHDIATRQFLTGTIGAKAETQPAAPAAPLNVFQHYRLIFPAAIVGDGLREAMQSMPVDSTCGDDCRQAIEAAGSLARHARNAWGDGYPGRINADDLATMAGQICGTYICG